jgi:hypothetical protein
MSIERVEFMFQTGPKGRQAASGLWLVMVSRAGHLTCKVNKMLYVLSTYNIGNSHLTGMTVGNGLAVSRRVGRV